MVGGLFAFLEDVGHAEGVAHLDIPIADGRREAIVEPIVAASLPRRDDLLLLLFALHTGHIVAAQAEANLWSDAQPRNHRFILVVLGPFAKVDSEQQRHIDIMRLLHVADGVVAIIQALLRTHALPRIEHVDFATDDGTLRDERDAHAAGEVGTEARAIVAAEVHGAEGRTEYQATAEALGYQRRHADEQKEEQYEPFFFFHGVQKYVFFAKDDKKTLYLRQFSNTNIMNKRTLIGMKEATRSSTTTPSTTPTRTRFLIAMNRFSKL